MHQRSPSSLKNFFSRRSKEYSGSDKPLELKHVPSQRPQTANVTTATAGIEGSRLHSRPQSAHSSRRRPRRHTDAGPYQQVDVPAVPALPSVENRYIEINWDAKSFSGSTRQRYSEDVADRNLRVARPDGQLPTTGRSVDILDHNLPGYPRVVAEKSRYSEGVADRNMSMSTLSISSKSHTSSDITHMRVWGDQIVALQDPETERLAARFQSDDQMKASVMLERMASTHSSHGTTIVYAPPIEVEALSDSCFGDQDLYPISSLDETAYEPRRRQSSANSTPEMYLAVKAGPAKSLTSLVSSLALSDAENVQPISILPRAATPPPIPRRATGHTTPEQSRRVSIQAASPRESLVSPQQLPLQLSQSSASAATVPASTSGLADESAKEGLKGLGLDLTDSKETHIYTQYDPAITKEVIKPSTHEIRQEQITREIHNHDIFHRILPIKQTEVLPARHFVRDEQGKLTEIPATMIPVGSSTTFTVKNVVSSEETTFAPRQFSASTLEGFVQDYAERLDENGVRRSHKTWIHPPVIQLRGMETGQTTPFEMSETK